MVHAEGPPNYPRPPQVLVDPTNQVCTVQIVELLSSGPHMAITAAAAWALYAATQGNCPVALAAYSSGALQPLLDLIQGGGSQV